MSIVLRSDFENVKAQLEDAQESLAAAFARIEVFRQREKLLLAEVSKLRTAQAVGASGTQTGEQTQQQDGSSTSTASQAAGTAPCTQQQDIPSTTQEGPPTQAQQQQADTGPDLPCYITEVEGHLPVMLLSSSSSRKTPGSIVITPDYVDFVEVRARIKRHAFIGITAASARGQSAGKSGLKLKHLLPSCISPSTAQQPSSPAAPRHPKPPGGPHLVQQPSSSGPSLTTGSFPTSTANADSSTGAWIAASAAADIQPETSSSSLNWQQQLHYQVELSAASAPTAAAAVGSPRRVPRMSAGAVGSPKSPPPAAVLSTTPETPGGWASPHSLRHCPTWHAGHAVTEAELTEAGAAAASGGGSGSPRGSNGSSGGWTEGEGGKDAKGVWKILWRGGGVQQQLSFEATQTTREVLHKHTLRWLGEAEVQQDELSQLAAAAAAAAGSGNGISSSTGAIAAGVAAAAAAAAGSGNGGAQLSVPRHLTPGSYTPRLSEPSAIIQSVSSSGRVSSSSIGAGGSSGIIPGSPSIGGISMGYGIGVGASARRTQSPSAAAPAAAAGGSSDQQQQQQQQLVAGLVHVAGALPPRYQSRDWQLLYSTGRHGISLQTLFRKAAGQSATVMLVRDAGGYVFGAFCPEAWKPNSRFFGTGETFVFQLAPHKVMWPWRLGSTLKNDFFQYAQPESIGIGGLGAFAIWLDGELLHGSSGSCGTFGSPCLASKEEFKVAVLELWGLQ